MKKTNLLFVIDSLSCGGAEKSLVTLLGLIDPNQFNIDLSLHSRGGIFEKLVPSFVNVNTIEINKGYLNLKYQVARFYFKFFRLFNTNKKMHNAQLYWKSFSQCHKVIAKKYDIAIAYGQGFSTYFISDKVEANIKYSWLNNDYIKAGYNLKFDIPFYSLYNKIVVVSEENEKVFQQCLKASGVAFTTVVIRDIVDDIEINFKSRLPIELVNSKESLVITTVGRLIPQKGLSLAIKACKLLIDKGKNVKWFVVGEGHEREALEELIRTYNLKENFILLGLKENPYPYIKMADIYVQSSVFEGLCITLIEARLLQKAIVTTNFPSAYGTIDHNRTGLICEMNPESIAESITRFLDEENLKEQIITNLMNQQNIEKELALVRFNELIVI